MTIYVFDSGPFINIFNHYYRAHFPSFWERFDEAISDRRITSTREVRNELAPYGDALSEWCKEHGDCFPTPTADELIQVRRIFEVSHFRSIIGKKTALAGKPVADPFVIARAMTLPDGCVVTTEEEKPNAAKIPNICDRFGVDCTDLEGFMTRENWSF